MKEPRPEPAEEERQRGFDYRFWHLVRWEIRRLWGRRKRLWWLLPEGGGGKARGDGKEAGSGKAEKIADARCQIADGIWLMA